MGSVLLAMAATSGPATAAGWLAPEMVSPVGLRPQVAVTADGIATALWLGGQPGGAQIAQAADRAPGGTWSATPPLSVPGGSLDAPAIATAKSGAAVAVWSANSVVRAAYRAPGAGWGAAHDLTDGGLPTGSTSAVITEDGTATVAWHAGTGGGREVQSSRRPAGGSWEPGLAISGLGTTGPQLAAAADGTVTAVWDHRDGWTETRTRPAGGGWSPTATLSGPDLPAGDVRIAVAPNGTAVAAWSQRVGSYNRVHAAMRAPGGPWGPPRILSSDGQPAYEPQISIAADGSALAAWTRSDGENGRLQATVRPAGGDWEAARTLSAAGHEAEEPKAVVTDGGSATIVWQRPNDDGPVAAHAVTRSGGAWSPTKNLTGTLEEGTQLQLAAAPNGDTTVVWHSGGSVSSAVLDASGPRLDGLSVPATGQVGSPVDFSVTPRDLWSPLGGTTWDFGDGGTAVGTGVSHTFPTVGVHTVTVSASDVRGNVTEQTRQIEILPVPTPPIGTPPTGPPAGPPVVPAADPCAAPFVTLLGAEPRGTKRRPTVRLTAVASRSLAGRSVTVTRDRRRIATAKVGSDGVVAKTVAAPKTAKARRKARYRLTLGATTSAPLAAGSTVTVRRQTTLSGNRVRIDGRVAGIRKATRLTLTGIPACGTAATTTTTVRTDKRGRFRVTIARPSRATATVYRIKRGRKTITVPAAIVRK